MEPLSGGSVADFLYNSARDGFAGKLINWTLANTKAMLVSGVYAPLPTHNFVSDIPTAAIAMRSSAMTANAHNAGVCSGIVPSFQALLWADPIVAIVIYIDSGSDSTSQLVYYSSGGIGFPFIAVGFDYFVGYDQSNGGWFEV